MNCADRKVSGLLGSDRVAVCPAILVLQFVFFTVFWRGQRVCFMVFVETVAADGKPIQHSAVSDMVEHSIM